MNQDHHQNTPHLRGETQNEQIASDASFSPVRLALKQEQWQKSREHLERYATHAHSKDASYNMKEVVEYARRGLAATEATFPNDIERQLVSRFDLIANIGIHGRQLRLTGGPNSTSYAISLLETEISDLARETQSTLADLPSELRPLWSALISGAKAASSCLMRPKNLTSRIHLEDSIGDAARELAKIGEQTEFTAVVEEQISFFSKVFESILQRDIQKARASINSSEQFIAIDTALMAHHQQLEHLKPLGPTHPLLFAPLMHFADKCEKSRDFNKAMQALDKAADIMEANPNNPLIKPVERIRCTSFRLQCYSRLPNPDIGIEITERFIHDLQEYDHSFHRQQNITAKQLNGHFKVMNAHYDTLAAIGDAGERHSRELLSIIKQARTNSLVRLVSKARFVTDSSGPTIRAISISLSERLSENGQHSDALKISAIAMDATHGVEVGFHERVELRLNHIRLLDAAEDSSGALKEFNSLANDFHRVTGESFFDTTERILEYATLCESADETYLATDLIERKLGRHPRPPANALNKDVQADKDNWYLLAKQLTTLYFRNGQLREASNIGKEMIASLLKRPEEDFERDARENPISATLAYAKNLKDTASEALSLGLLSEAAKFTIRATNLLFSLRNTDGPLVDSALKSIDDEYEGIINRDLSHNAWGITQILSPLTSRSERGLIDDDDTIRDVFIALGECYEVLSEIEGSKELHYSNAAVAIHQAICIDHDDPDSIESYLMLSINNIGYLRDTGNYQLAMRRLEQAKGQLDALCKKHPERQNIWLEGQLLIHEANLIPGQIDHNNFLERQQMLFRALAIFTELEAPLSIAEAHTELGELHLYASLNTFDPTSSHSESEQKRQHLEEAVSYFDTAHNNLLRSGPVSRQQLDVIRGYLQALRLVDQEDNQQRIRYLIKWDSLVSQALGMSSEDGDPDDDGLPV